MIKIKSFSIIIAATIFTACTSIERKPADDGANGHAGACGVTGATGQSGSINAAYLYTLYPLCNVANVIVSANDVSKLREFLNAGCDPTRPALPGSGTPLWDGAVARMRTDLVKVLLADPKTKSRIDLYGPIKPNPLDNSATTAQLNPFEVTVYHRILNQIGTEPDTYALENLVVDSYQFEMLNTLLAASDDKAKLINATSKSLYYLRRIPLQKSACAQPAAEAITRRIRELSN